MNYIVNKNLTDIERYIREEVFVREQGFINEIDDLEDSSFHLLYKYNNNYVACSRFYELKDGIYKLGRVAVLKEYRNKKIGTLMMECVFEYLRLLGAKTIIVHSQIQAQEFYKKNGFRVIGDIFLEENYPHIEMIKEL